MKRDLLMVIAGLLQAGLVLGALVYLALRISHKPRVRAFIVGLLLSPVFTLALGVGLGAVRHGMAAGRGLYPQVFTPAFVGGALLLSFAICWFVSLQWFLHLAARKETRAAGR